MNMTINKAVGARDASQTAENRKFPVAEMTCNESSKAASRLVEARIDEAEVPGWVYHTFFSQDVDGTTPVASERIGTAKRNIARLSQAPTRESAVCDLVHLALSGSGYPLRNVRCRCDGDTLILSGFVTRYFYAQMALETARRLAGDRRIQIHIEVLPATVRDPAEGRDCL